MFTVKWCIPYDCRFVFLIVSIWGLLGSNVSDCFLSLIMFLHSRRVLFLALWWSLAFLQWLLGWSVSLLARSYPVCWENIYKKVIHWSAQEVASWLLHYYCRYSLCMTSSWNKDSLHSFLWFLVLFLSIWLGESLQIWVW